MDNEKEEGFISKDKALADLRVIKQMLEETRTRVLPGMSILIFWGIWVFVGNLFTQIIVWKNLPHQYIGIGWLVLLLIAVIFNILFWSKISRIIKGMHPYLSKQLGYIWWTLMGLCGFFTGLGFPFGIFTEDKQIGYIWAVFISAGLCITGIIYSWEFLIAGFCAFIGIFVAAAFPNHTYLLLGVFLCLAAIIPVILSRKRFKRLEEKDE